MITLTTTAIIVRIAIAIGLGMVIGLERTLTGKTAGMRTYAMITLGSSLFVVISEIIIATINNPLVASPLAIPGAVITGIGFIGAGLIIFQANKITGLTTAAGLWVTAGVGIACGFGLFTLAIIATIAVLVIFTIMLFLENSFRKHFSKFDHDNGEEKIQK